MSDLELGVGVAFDPRAEQRLPPEWRPPRAYVGRHEASAYLLDRYGIGAYQTLSNGAATGDSPEYSKVGRRVLYRLEDLDTWARGKIKPRKSFPQIGGRLIS